MKCSRCGEELRCTYGKVDEVMTCQVDPCPKCCEARKPIQWHPPKERPLYKDTTILRVRSSLTIEASPARYGGPFNDDVAWCYEEALTADARAAMEGTE